MEDRRKKYLRIFRTEADEHLATINLGLVDIEQGRSSPGLIHDIFRAAHTLKGSARMLGLEEIGAIAHKMEDLLKEIENANIKVTPSVIDCLLAGADGISRLLGEEEPAVLDHNNIIDNLILILEGKEPGEKTAAPPLGPAARKPMASGPDPSQEDTATKPQADSRGLDSPASHGPAPLSSPETPLAGEDIPAGEAATTETARASRSTADTLRVEASRLDQLIDISGELLISKLKLEERLYNSKQVLDELTALVSKFDSSVNNGQRADFKSALQNLRNLVHENYQEFTEDVIELDLNVQDIQSGALNLRMTPAATLFDEFPRLVRDLARELDKDIRLQVRGEDTEVDKRLLEQLRGPLIHILRNSCDHGIERPEERENAGKPRRGKITIQAYHQGAWVVIEVSDDGRGMDADRIRKAAVERGLLEARKANELPDEEIYYLALRPGFSTSAIITDLSGRGVGLDVVKTNVEALRGDLYISSSPGRGTTIQLRLPLTISIISALLISQGGEVYAIPLTAVEEVARVRVAELVTDRGREALTVRGRLLPLARLGSIIGLAPLPGHERKFRSAEDLLHIIVLKYRNQQIALEVDVTLREQEILVKSLGSHIGKVPLISGATILRKGEPALILNVFDIFNEALRLDKHHGIRQEVMAEKTEKRAPRVMVVDDSITTRTIEKNILERAGYEVETAVNAEEALIKTESAAELFDLFVIDVDMPGMNGFELTEKIRQDNRTREIPVIICTSRSTDEDKRKGISVGAQGYIVKGAFDQNVLLDTVKSLIGE